MKCTEQTVKAQCPECGHEQLVDLKYANGSEMIRDGYSLISDREFGVVFGGYKCLCGKYVEVQLLTMTRPLRKFN